MGTQAEGGGVGDNGWFGQRLCCFTAYAQSYPQNLWVTCSRCYGHRPSILSNNAWNRLFWPL